MLKRSKLNLATNATTKQPQIKAKEIFKNALQSRNILSCCLAVESFDAKLLSSHTHKKTRHTNTYAKSHTHTYTTYTVTYE